MPILRYRREQGGMATLFEKVIKKHLKAEVMNTPEFKDIEIQIREEKLLRIKWDEQRKRSMEKQRYRAKMER